MNILFITYQGDIAGSTNSISYLSRGLAEKGHNIYVGCRKEALLWQLLEGSKVQRIPMTFKNKFDWTNIKQIKNAVQKYDIQLINAQSSYDRYTTAFAKWIFGLKVSIIHTRRQTPLSVGGFVQNWFYKKATQKIVAVSQGVKNALVRLGLPENHIQVIYNGTPKEKYDLKNSSEKTTELFQKYGIKPNETVIGCIARNKQQEQILQAIQLISKPLTVLLVGIAAEEKYTKLILPNTPHKVIFTGTIDGKETLYHYNLLKIKILPSIIEGLSQSLLEAMALGVPVIATNAAGNPDLVRNSENGFLFEEGNFQELARKIELLLNDESLRQKFIIEGKKTAFVDFSIENTIRNYEIFFEKIIQNQLN